MNASDVINRITEYFDKEELKYDYNEELMRFDYGFCIDNEIVQKVDCLILVDSDGDDCQIVGYPNIKAKLETKKELESLLFGINCNTFRGIWQLCNDEVRYIRTLALEGDAVLTDEMLDMAVFSVPNIIAKYADSMVAVVMGYSKADDELKKLYDEDGDADDQSEDAEETSNQTECNFDELESILLWVKGDKDEGDNRKV
ncbi:hypothetical protein [Butyrivibrio sp. VCB2006]|uniref:hypothetical protein n=1 Tax=Butyrivibrio sp. VCB2006 TaxID=1280679 RepID=UPI000429A922|nr:hypothetical protein [Butyrivibrio sp. VCB2006]